MPHKNNPAAAIAILGCTRQVPGLLATLAAAAEQEHQRAAGAWHAEWEPLSDLLRLTGSAASWGADLLASLEPDPARMRDNLLAAGGFPMAERVASLLSPELGRTAAHEVMAQASTRAVAGDRALREVLLEAPEVAEAGITAGELDEALDPTEYLGSSASFVAAALAAYRAGA
jgi:3-carboxy-cis,cis-muconate cycloisomerase